MARDATPRRRSARLSKPEKQTPSAKKTPLSKLQLASVLERDETPESREQQSIDDVIETPNAAERVQQQLSELSRIVTPKTEPRPDPKQMHPQTVHQSTSKAPDSGLKLGFADISTRSSPSLATLHNTPTRPHRQSIVKADIPPAFQFKFSHGPNLSSESRSIMEGIREEATRIKAEMQAEKELQDRTIGSDSATRPLSGRKIAKPKGRFSDVHKAQFQRMDSIANHPSAFRARPDLTPSSAPPLKRTSSRAGLDEVERPRTAGKGTPGHHQPSLLGRSHPVSPFKSIPIAIETPEDRTSVKRSRQSNTQDVSAAKSKVLPRPASSRLLSPTKSSLARAGMGQYDASSSKPNSLSRFQRLKSPRSNRSAISGHRIAPNLSASSPVRSAQVSTNLQKPLPALPDAETPELRMPDVQKLQTPVTEANKSKLPIFGGLKSILRSSRKHPTTVGHATTSTHRSIGYHMSSPGKKVDFTPSVKSRYAVKLAAESPSPAKVARYSSVSASVDNNDAYPWDNNIDCDTEDELQYEREEESGEVVYPELPPSTPEGPRVHTFAEKARQLNRRESTEFKSIFTTLHPTQNPSSSLTTINTVVNQKGPIAHVDTVMRSPKNLSVNSMPSTIRHVRPSVVHDTSTATTTELHTFPHGLPGKKRRYESTLARTVINDEEHVKENRALAPETPSALEEPDEYNSDEGVKRGGKRARMTTTTTSNDPIYATKKSSTAREQAAKSAKDRKVKSMASRGALSLSRLNLLARPKQRN